MRNAWIFALAAASAVAGMLATAAPARADELITNGNFETGTSAGWTIANQAGGSGNWFIDTPGSTAPLSGLSTIGGASFGSFYAVTDQTGPGSHVLYQSFTVTGGESVVLNFDMFRNDWDSGPIFGSGLDFGSGANQYARVDIMNSVASPFDTGGSVVSALILGVDAGGDPNAFTHYMFDMTSAVSGGGTFWLRFAEVDNQSFFNMGVDNVSIVATTPEPATLALVGLGTGILGWRRRRSRA